MFQFNASRISVELPINLAVSIITVICPSFNLITNLCQLINTSIKALELHDTELNFSYVEPATMFWRVVYFKALG